MTPITTALTATRQAARALNKATDDQRRRTTLALADAVDAAADAILAANSRDLAAMPADSPLRDRLLLTPDRLADITRAARQVANLPDVAGITLAQKTHPKGFSIAKITVPLGVVGAIFEARPNVTIDIAALCIRSGNAVVLKGGSDATHTNTAIAEVLRQALAAMGFSPECLLLLPNDRAATTELLMAHTLVDVLVPRGSQSLIDYVRQHATVPVIETGAGVCHTYLHASAAVEMAAAIVHNAKTQRPSVCNALDTILVDREAAARLLPVVAEKLGPAGVVIYADAESHAILLQAGYPHLQAATPDHYGREYLSLQCSVKVVEGEREALDHIARYSSRHSECIVAEDEQVAARFLTETDAAAVYHNVSTRFTDGGEFGLGAELGISTQKLHARGPFALEKLVCEKWVVQGKGQTR